MHSAVVSGNPAHGDDDGAGSVSRAEASPASARWIVAAYGTIVIGRLLLEVALFHAGFLSLTADEFARVVLAARWAEHPFWVTHGEWLPLHVYLYGSSLAVWWNLVWAPRVLTIALGALGILAIGELTRVTLRSGTYGVVAAALLAVDPGHVWLSATPLTEAAYTASAAAALVALVRHVRSGGRSTALASAVLLGLAGGFRYEGWMLAIPYSALMLGRAASGERRDADRIALLASALIPWIGPGAWIAGSWVATGDPMQFMHAIQHYKLTWYGGDQSYAAYVRTWWRLDPWATVLAGVGCVLALARARRDGAPAAYAAVWLGGAATFVALHRGQVESTNNMIRYLGPFLFLTYPLVLYAVREALDRAHLPPRARRSIAAVALAIVIPVQVRQAFAYTPDGNAAGLAVGRRIRELRAGDRTAANEPVMIELHYWSYLAVHVGADDVDGILYDRTVDLAHRSSESLLSQPWPVVEACLAHYGIRFLAVASPNLRAVVERHGIAAAAVVGDWKIFRVPTRQGGAADAACPVDIGMG